MDIKQDVGENRGRVTGAQYDGAHNAITLNVGDKTPREIEELIARLPRINNIVLGDGLRWDGVVQEIRKLEEQVKQLTEHMITLQDRITSMESKMGQPKEDDVWSTWLTRFLIIAGTIAIVVQAWQIFFQ